MIFDPAVCDANETAVDDGTRTRTWAEISDRATRTARLLREDLGLAPGDHAALLMENRVEFIETVLGARLSGIWLTPLNWHLLPQEIAYIVEDSGAQVVITDDRFNVAAREAGAKQVIVAGAKLDAALAGASDEPFPLDGPAGGTMIYTSGTSGRPKGVKRRAPQQMDAWLKENRAAGMGLGLDGSGPHLVTGPLYHAAPLGFSMIDLYNGAPLVLMQRWDEALTLELLVERGIHHTHVVPTMCVRLLRLPEDVRAAFSAPELQLVLHGAAPIAPKVKERMIDWWGPVLVEYWGGTEGGVCTLVRSKDWLAHRGTVGRAVPHYEVFAADDDGRRLSPGEVGTLYSRHKKVPEIFEYHGDPEKTASAFLEPSAYTLGDMGHVDEEGYVYLADRRSNLIISGGVNIYPAEIEHALIEHPAVADVAVFGIPDEEWGESVKAAVQLAPGLEPSEELAAEIIAFGREHLAGYKVPRSVDFERELPRHISGKLLTRRLRERYRT